MANNRIRAEDLPPTHRQLAVLRFIAEHIDGQGYPPTLREIVEAIGIESTNGANDHLKGLARRGLVKRRPLVSRGIVITDAGREVLLSATQPAAADGAEGGS